MGGLWRLFILVSIPPILAYRPLIKNEMNFYLVFIILYLKKGVMIKNENKCTVR